MRRLYHHHVCFLHNKRRRKLISSQTDRSGFSLVFQSLSLSLSCCAPTPTLAQSNVHTHFEQWPKKTLQMSNTDNIHLSIKCLNVTMNCIFYWVRHLLDCSSSFSVLISIVCACVRFLLHHFPLTVFFRLFMSTADVSM